MRLLSAGKRQHAGERPRSAAVESDARHPQKYPGFVTDY
jgi:hypothetical protein